jgi:hypothetical protein
MDGVAACFVELKDPRASIARRDDSHGSEISGDPAIAACNEAFAVPYSGRTQSHVIFEGTRLVKPLSRPKIRDGTLDEATVSG